MDKTLAAALFAWLVILACQPAPETHDAGISQNVTDAGHAEDASVNPPWQWMADQSVTGPRLWIEAQKHGEHGTVASVWAAQLGATLGASLHVRFDPQQLGINAQEQPAAEMNTTLLNDQTVSLAVPRAGNVALGISVKNTQARPFNLDQPVLLAVVQLSAVRDGSSRIELDRVVVRRMDGSFVPVQTTGGVLSTSGGAP